MCSFLIVISVYCMHRIISASYRIVSASYHVVFYCKLKLFYTWLMFETKNLRALAISQNWSARPTYSFKDRIPLFVRFDLSTQLKHKYDALFISHSPDRPFRSDL